MKPAASALLALLLALVPSSGAGQQAAQAGSTVMLLDIEGGIGPATHDYIQRGLEQAVETGAPAVVLRIDTPGGLDAATRDINQAILASEVPVIAWVAPPGARAASAGTYILYACHLAAMAPATSLGAATPVALGGGFGTPPRDDGDARKREKTSGDGEPDDSERKTAREPGPDAGGDAMAHKVVNDSVAYLRSLAELRGRNADFAERAVRDAATLTASQALEQRVIEIVAGDIATLLREADGREVRVGRRTIELATAGRAVTRFEPDWRIRLLSVITEPTVAYLLLLVGLYGLVFEGYSPGAIVPGVVGAISLLLALYALQVLPVNYAGVALIALGVVLMAVEIAMPSFGALGIGGLVALVAGSLILFDVDAPGYGVPGRLVTGIAIASGLGFMGIVWLAARARKQPVVTGMEELIGREAVALQDFDGRGRVHVRGEDWRAESDQPVRRGQRLSVQAIDGLVLHVAPLARTDGDRQ